MMSSRINEMNGIQMEITEMEQLRDFAAVTSEVFATKRENVILEAQLAELQERQKVLSSIKGRLDEAVRLSTERAAREKREHKEALLRGILERLKDPKMQDLIFKKSLEDLEKVRLH